MATECNFSSGPYRFLVNFGLISAKGSTYIKIKISMHGQQNLYNLSRV